MATDNANSDDQPTGDVATPGCPHDAGGLDVSATDRVAIDAISRRLLRLYASHPSETTFRQFSPTTDLGYATVLTAITEASQAAGGVDAKADALNAALATAETLMASADQHPELVKYALGVFWTHSKEAQALRIGVPHLGQYRQLRSEAPASPLFENAKPVVSTSPATADGPPTPVVNHAYATITGDNFGPGDETLLAFWREDFDFNDHHMHWHMVYPGGGTYDPTTKQMVEVIDRRGELFLYMHSQILSRYDQERLCWDLPTTKAWTYDDVIEQGYTPVPSLIDGYGARPEMHGWYPVRNPNIPAFSDAPFPINTLMSWNLNLKQAIKDHKLHIRNKTNPGERSTIELSDDNMLNWIGSIVESASLAYGSVPGQPGWEVDPDLYGNLHNFGHDKFAEIGYHSYRSDLNPLGLMISNFGSPRDHCFYPWHRHIATFRELASEQFPQDVTAMAPAGVTVVDVRIEPIDPKSSTPIGGITTTMGPPSLEYSEANAKLDHEPYQWSVTIECAAASATNPVEVDVRLFVVCDVLKEKQHTYVEMDKWPVTLTQPTTVIIHEDMDSSVVRKIANYAGSNTDQGYSSPWCLCGWPRNSMLPSGKPEGFPMQALCCVTLPKLHRVAADDLQTPAISYCGAQLNERVYPDDLGMGYPFDRAWTQQQDPSVLSLSQIIDAQPNMKMTPFSIYRTTVYYNGKTVPPEPNKIAWATIHGYFRPMDIGCMKNEYGYDFNSEIDVTLHAAALYDALSHKRMPKDGAFWSQEMLDTFFEWMHQPISSDVHDRVARRALDLYLSHGNAKPITQ